MKSKLLIPFFLILSLLYFSPYFIKGKAVYIPVHDNLNQLNMQGIFDGKMKACFFPNENLVEFTLPGTNPIYHLAHLKLDKLFFSFDYFWGFVFNEIFYRILAFLGIFFLLKKYVQKNRLSEFFIGLLCFAFVTLPHWPQGNLSIAGIPLLIYAFLNLYHKRNVLISYLIFLFFPFYSNLFLSGMFLILIMFIALIYVTIKKKMNIFLPSAFFSLLLCYVISHYPVFLNEFIYQIPTNRADQILGGLTLWRSLKVMIHNFFLSYNLAPSLHAAIILPSCLIITLLVILKKDRKKLKSILPLWSALFLLSILYGLFYWNPVLNLYNNSQLGFRFDRLYVLNPVIWFLLWSILLGWIGQTFRNKFSKIVLVILLGLQIALNLYFYTFRAYSEKPTFKEFMSEEQFAEIRKNLPEIDNDFRIGCIGFYPAVANFNSFKTVDSFSAYYPLEYKNSFRKIINNELTQNKALKDYFENKGSALFLFDDEIGTHYTDQEYLKQNIRSITCDLNLPELKKFGVEYLFSTVEVGNAKQINLQKIDYQISARSYYKIFVYKIN
ncbi:MAG: DUF6044 family protein [Candidatus Cloacimonadales bacterium]|nr:DUF6044 family protein [Candidatus Cloacimonadales bacterium]